MRLAALSRLAAAPCAAALASLVTACGGGGGGGDTPGPGPGPTTPTIAVAVSPGAAQAVQGQSTTVTVTVTRGGGYTGAVTLAADGAPGGVTPTFSPASLASGVSTSTLTLAVGATTAPGSYSITVRASGTGVTAQTATVQLTVTAAAQPDFALTATPGSVTVQAGQSGTSTITVTRSGGFAGEVALVAEGAPSGVTPAFAPATIATGATTSALTLAVAPTVAPGTYPITIRGSGAGGLNRTTTVQLTVTAPPGGLTLSAAPAALSVQAGQSGTSTITITRSGSFTGTVNLSASGAPAGVTASFNPAAATGGTSTLTLVVGASVAAGTYPITVTGQGTGVSNATTTVQLTVTAGGGGGSGNVQWRFCDPAEYPLWFAFRNGTSGAWTRVAPDANQTYSFTVTTVGGVAWVEPVSGGVADAYVWYGTLAELQQRAADQCLQFPQRKSLQGSVAGVGALQGAVVSVGPAVAQLFPGSGTAYTLDGVPVGSADLVAYRFNVSVAGSSVAYIPDRMVLRRATNYAAGSTIPLIDFNGSEAFAPATATITVGNAAGGQLTMLTALQLQNGRVSGFAFGNLTGGTSPLTAYGLPASRLLANEFHLLQVSSTVLSGSVLSEQRSVAQYTRELTNRTLALGASLTAPTYTVQSTSPYVRIRASGPWQADYGSDVSAGCSQSETNASRSWTMYATRAYLGAGSSYELEMPELASVPQFQTTWGLRPGIATSCYVLATGYSGTGIAEGVTARSALRFSTLTP